MDQKDAEEIRKVIREAQAVGQMFEGRLANTVGKVRRGVMTGNDGQRVNVADALLDPARFTALSIGGLMTNPEAMLDSGALASGIKMLAAQLQAGNMDYVYEALVGQTITLEALSGVALEAAMNCPMAKDKALLFGLAVRAQTAKAKVLCSLPAVAGAAGGANTGVWNDDRGIVKGGSGGHENQKV